MSDAEKFVKKAFHKPFDTVLDAATQVSTGGIYGYDDGSFNPDGLAVGAAREGVKEGMKLVSNVFAGEETGDMAMTEMDDTTVNVESPDNAADEVAKDKGLSEAAMQDRKKRTAVGSSRSANLLRNSGRSLKDDDELSVSSLLA